MENKILDNLIGSGEIKDYELETVEDTPGSGSRETDKLTITLLSGKKLVIETFCSGCAENTSLFINEE